MKRTIYLVDPAGGGIQESPGLIVVRHKVLREIGFVDVHSEKVTDPGMLTVTQAALNLLDEQGVISAFVTHLSGQWWGDDEEAHEENDAALYHGGSIYNIDRVRGIMCITYPGDYTSLITSEEY